MKNKLHIAILLLFVLTQIQTLHAQDLGSIGKSKALKITGGINANQIFYGSNQSNAYRDPYSYFLSGNINFNLYGWSIPFSYSYSNQNSQFQQPFNQYSMHPRYKWVTAHLGYTSMSFSPYTLSGHLFAGAGLDLSPGDNWEIQLMYGRLKKAVPSDTARTRNNPSYRRRGYGIKSAYKYKQGRVEVMLFRSSDDQSSLDSMPQDLDIYPEENMVMSIKKSLTLISNMKLDVEYASSAFTRDTRVEESSNGAGVFAYLGPLFTPRQSSAYYQAMNASLQYSLKTAALSVRYERIDPEYQTHGAYYFTNDMENISLQGNTSLLQQKLRISANLGLQRDNLDDQKVSSMKRMVGALSLGYQAGKKMNINLNYSSYQSYTNIRSKFEEINALTPYDNLDTLDFTQITQSVNGNLSYTLKSTETNRQHLNLNASYQQAAEKQADQPQNAGNNFLSVNTGYSYTVVPLGLSITASVNYNQNMSPGLDTKTLGPTLSAGKSFFNKTLRSNLGISLNNAYTNSELTTSVANIRLSNQFTYKKSHSLSLSMIYLYRDNKTLENVNSFSEFTATLGYNYRFQ